MQKKVENFLSRWLLLTMLTMDDLLMAHCSSGYCSIRWFGLKFEQDMEAK